jgi:hypothetical protein
VRRSARAPVKFFGAVHRDLGGPPGLSLVLGLNLPSVAALPEDQRAETLTKVDAIISAGETPPELPIHVVIGLKHPRLRSR